ncbi:kinase-like domain-containing protein [Absidia repens]|uniref:Kinase-like domain-containing protein n=1 Tax=Absidia repens TaxID=90262 RepID=A0A1X2I2N6_9FUNG|nr:kinase-like domain-containing protein [Absidia repens]
MPCPTVQNQLISVFETTFYVKRELVTVFNIVIQTSAYTVSLFRYPSDFAEFHQKIRCHYPRSKVPFPELISSNGQLLLPSPSSSRKKTQPSSTGHRKLHHKRKPSTLKILQLFQLYSGRPKKSNADQIEDYLEKCFQHPIISISSLLRDFLRVQREDDSRIESALTNATTTTAEKQKLVAAAAPASSPLDPSKKISLDQFELLKVIGKGCMGKKRQLYALKVISKQKVLQQNEIQHTKAERDILTRLRDQPFLIKLHYAFQSPTHLYFVLDYICGGDIATQMSLCLTFSKERTQFYAAEILLGLSILHSHGIIYRDLKPENVLIGRDGHIVLTDFGLSKVFKMQDKRDMGLPTTSTFCGTSEYIGPEILLGEQYSYAVDYWSLGTLIYEMLAGMTPFWAETHMEMFRRVLEDNLEFPSSEAFDPITCEFLSGLLERDPYDRLGWDSSEQIKKHAYFANLDWDDVAQRKLVPPYLPTIRSETDLTHFDTSFVTMTPRISQVPSVAIDGNKNDELEEQVEEDPFRHFDFDPAATATDEENNDDDDDDDDNPVPVPVPARTLLRSSRSHPKPWGATASAQQRFSTSSSVLSFGTEIVSSRMLANDHQPSLSTSVRKRHSAALSLETASASALTEPNHTSCLV